MYTQATIHTIQQRCLSPTNLITLKPNSRCDLQAICSQPHALYALQLAIQRGLRYTGHTDDISAIFVARYLQSVGLEQSNLIIVVLPTFLLYKCVSNSVCLYLHVVKAEQIWVTFYFGYVSLELLSTFACKSQLVISDYFLYPTTLNVMIWLLCLLYGE